MSDDWLFQTKPLRLIDVRWAAADWVEGPLTNIRSLRETMRENGGAGGFPRSNKPPITKDSP